VIFTVFSVFETSKVRFFGETVVATTGRGVTGVCSATVTVDVGAEGWRQPLVTTRSKTIKRQRQNTRLIKGFGG